MEALYVTLVPESTGVDGVSVRDVVPLLTTWDSEPDEPLKFELPEYVAAIAKVPAFGKLTVHDTVPLPTG
jgi:hypothetical protein